MANKSLVTYIPPKDKFLMVGNAIITKFMPEVIGVYCKIANLSSGKTLSIDSISKRIGVSDKKVRKIIVLLEQEGYVVRSLIRGERGAFNGWNYSIYAEPVPESKRSRAGVGAGVKSDIQGVDGVTQNRTSPLSDNTENGQDHTIIDNNNISYSNNKDFEDNNTKVSTGVDTQSSTVQNRILTDEEERFYKHMNECYPFVQKLSKPLTFEQYIELNREYKFKFTEIEDMLAQMENYPKLLKTKRVAFLTLKVWLEREHKKEDAA